MNNQINSAMSSQRSDDFASLKHPMLEYILTNRNSDTLQPPIPKSSCKSNRGTNHPRLARELCPRKWLDKFDIDVDLYVLVFISFRSFTIVYTEEFSVFRMGLGLCFPPIGHPSYMQLRPYMTARTQTSASSVGMLVSGYVVHCCLSCAHNCSRHSSTCT